MRHLFREVPEACDNTLLIAERADVQIELGQAEPARVPGAGRLQRRDLRGAGGGLPARPHPRGCPASATAPRCPTRWSSGSTTSSGVIGNMGFAAYFLVVWDLIRFARESGSASGPAGARRPDAAWPTACSIVDLDPIRYDLLFERFLIPAASRCPTSTWTSTSATAPTSCATPRSVRQRPRGPGHHVLDDQGAGRRARRGAGARQAVQRGRPDRQGDRRPSSSAATPLPPRASPGRRARGLAAAAELRRSTTTTPTPRRS